MTRPVLTASLIVLAALAVIIAPRVSPVASDVEPSVVLTENPLPLHENPPVREREVRDAPSQIIPEALDKTPVKVERQPRGPKVVLPNPEPVPWTCGPCGMG